MSQWLYHIFNFLTLTLIFYSEVEMENFSVSLYFDGPFNILLTISNVAPTYLLTLIRVLVEY